MTEQQAVIQELRDAAKECRQYEGVPCQSEYRWHAEQYEAWADRLAAADRHEGAASVVDGLPKSDPAMAVTQPGAAGQE